MGVTKVSPQPQVHDFGLSWAVSWNGFPVCVERILLFGARGGTDFCLARGMDFRACFYNGTDFDPVLEI